jgi:two-component system OmpR family sensor kinase
LKKYEKEALVKSFFIFFLSLEILNVIIFSFYLKEQKDILSNSIFQMIKEYNYNFENKDIAMGITELSKDKEKYKLYINDDEIYAYFDLLDSKENLLKLSYDFDLYKTKLNDINVKTSLLFVVVSIILFVYSFFYSLYSLKPLKNAIELLERFLKDFIHDLNTPISSIFVNISILKRNYNTDAIDRIDTSAKTISNLYKNLEQYIHINKFTMFEVDVLEIIQQRVFYFKKLFPHIEFSVPKEQFNIITNDIAITRILDNLISNACKYNKKDGSVEIIFQNNNTIIVKDNGQGIKNTQKAFDRFYKENERGLGIGLNIVKKLSDELKIDLKLSSVVGEGTTVELHFLKDIS